MERLHERSLTPDELSYQDTILDIAVRISEEDARHARVRLALVTELREMGYDEDDIARDPGKCIAAPCDGLCRVKSPVAVMSTLRLQ